MVRQALKIQTSQISINVAPDLQWLRWLMNRDASGD